MRYKEPKPWAYLYRTKQWKAMRLHHLELEPCCVYCLKQGAVSQAIIVDHIRPHKGDEDLFFDADNLQGLCKKHHDASKQREERAGGVIGSDTNGVPIDPCHHWNA